LKFLPKFVDKYKERLEMKIDKMSARQIGQLQVKVSGRLNDYKPAFVTEAPNSIAHKKGHRSWEALRETYHLIDQIITDPMGQSSLRPGLKERKAKLNPYNLLRKPMDYVNLQIVLENLHENLSGIKILQLACNYGPYLHYLQQVEGINAFGVDVDQEAVVYANKYGLSNVRASSLALPFREGVFDCVLSHHFLEGDYLLGLPVDVADLVNFIPKTVAEAYRILKPGGLFVSEEEDVFSQLALQSFSQEDRSFRALSSRLRVFQK